MDIYLPLEEEKTVYSVLRESFLEDVLKTDGLVNVTYLGENRFYYKGSNQEGFYSGATEEGIKKLIYQVAGSIGFIYDGEPIQMYIEGETFRLVGVVGDDTTDTFFTFRKNTKKR